jgi:hypothetical protein
MVDDPLEATALRRRTLVLGWLSVALGLLMLAAFGLILTAALVLYDRWKYGLGG